MKKKLGALILAVLMLTMAILPMTASANVIGTKYVKTSSGSSVRMRRGPSADYDAIARVPHGTKVETYSSMENEYGEKWTEIGYNGSIGWINSRYLSSKKPTSSSSSSSSSSSGSSGSSGSSTALNASIFNGFTQVGAYADIRPSTPGNFVNLRWAPSKTAPVVSRYYEGQQVYVLKANKNWCQVYDPDKCAGGFILRSLLDY